MFLVSLPHCSPTAVFAVRTASCGGRDKPWRREKTHAGHCLPELGRLWHGQGGGEAGDKEGAGDVDLVLMAYAGSYPLCQQLPCPISPLRPVLATDARLRKHIVKRKAYRGVREFKFLSEDQWHC